MKRLIIDYRLAASSTRGMARYCREITSELLYILPKDVTVILYVDRTANMNLPVGVEKRILPTNNYIIGEQWWIPFFLKKDKANIFWAPANTFPLYKVRGVRYIATIHDLIFFDKPEGKQSIVQKVGMYYRRFVVSMGIRKLDGCCSVSEYSKKRIENRFGLKDIIVTPNCISHFLKKINELKNHGEYSRSDFFFTVSGDAPSKNFEALYKWFKVRPMYKLVAAGIRKESANRKNCPSNIVILPPNVLDVELIKYYLTCKAFLFISKQEGFGIPVLEAMACGCKLILSNSTSIPEIAGDNAIYVSPEIIDELEEAIMRVESYEINSQKMKLQLDNYTDWKKSAQMLMESIVKL